ncbi:MAG: GspH/FimT family pseudopilin [Gammaproteobacteria bacterium]|nr:GspH/FimT family pseudopilin [Gammaproteobacteria bacterium]
MTQQTGLTLIELLFAMAILAILTTISVPGFTNLVLNTRMTAQVNRFVHDIHLAKQTAHRRMQQVALCKSPDGRQCAPNREWHEGWLVFVNLDRDRPPHVDPGESILAANPAFESGTISANRPDFVFRAFEIRSTNGTLTFCDRRGSDAARAVIVSYTGRPRMAAVTARKKPLRCPV